MPDREGSASTAQVKIRVQSLGGISKILARDDLVLFPSALSSRYQRLPGLTKVGLAAFRRTHYI